MFRKCSRSLLGRAVWWLGWTLCLGGALQSVPAAGAAGPQMLSPADGATLTSATVTFTWQSTAGVSQYALWVGSAADGYDIYAAVVGGTSRTVTLPTDGRKLYVTLWGWVNGGWLKANSYTYTAHKVALATMLSPADGATLTSHSVTFNWQGSAGVSQYALWVGSAPDGYDIYAATLAGYSRTVTVPTDGRTLYVTLWAWASGMWQKANSYTYTASTIVMARMVSPAGGETLTSGSVTFTWEGGVGVSQFALWVGNAPDKYDIYSAVVGGLSKTVTLPTDGRKLYVTLWAWVGGGWLKANSYTYTAYTAAGPVKAQIVSPADGTTFTSGSATFTWEGVYGVGQYALWVGSAPLTYDVFAAVVGGVSKTVSLPVDGRTLYVTLFQWVGGAWQQADTSTYTAYTAPLPVKAQMILPVNGTVLAGARTTFMWDSGVGVTQYALWVGSTPSSYDLYAAVETGQSRTLNMPVDGRPIYVTLWSMINGRWQSNSYAYTAAAPVAAQMISPPPVVGATLTSGVVMFEWTSGFGATRYALWVGSSHLTYDVHTSIETGLSRTVMVPTDGRTLYVTLWTEINGEWEYNIYTYTAGTTSLEPVKAQMLGPTPGQTLTGSAATFLWDKGVGVTQYALWVGNKPLGYELYGRTETGLSRTLTVPTDGRTLYVTLWSLINGAWQSNAYTYTTATATTARKAQMVAPSETTALTSSSVTFIWDGGIGVTRYALWVGNAPGTYDLYARFETGASRTMTLPMDGRTVYVTLWSLVNGTWESNAYAYTTTALAKAQITSPVPGTTLTSATTTFVWNSGAGVSQYALWIGSEPSSYDLYMGLGTSLTRTLDLPTDGRTLYVTLWSYLNGAWQSNAYTYTAFTTVPAQITSPANGSTLPGASVTFEWNSGAGVTRYMLWVGSAWLGNDLHDSVETGLSRTVTVPTDGSTIHVTLWSEINGEWAQPNTYIYTAAGP